MFRSWSIVIAFTVLAVQPCVGETSCVLWASAGPVVQLGSSFEVYCTFKFKCKGSIYKEGLPVEMHKELNSTTIYFNVVNISQKTTYSCNGNCNRLMDPCGMDIWAGYPPEHAKNISCIYKIQKNENGDVICTWNRGRDTHLANQSMLWVRTVTGDHREEPVQYYVSSKGTELLLASFSMSRSVQQISVWVETQNQLGSVKSSVVNYTVSDIAMPAAPVLEQLECSSRICFMKVEQSVRTQYLQIQYRTELQQQWTTDPDSAVQMTSSQARSISSLEPYRLYYFRARSKLSTGLWSQWSSVISSWTQEEAPDQALDIWLAPAFDFKSMRVYWKEANTYISRGKIIEYALSVNSPNLSVITNVSADARSYLLPYCGDCEVTVCARNSKGSSPPATITTFRTEGKFPPDARTTTDNRTVTISWREPETAPAQYVVEWYPEGLPLEKLRWVRLSNTDSRAVITGMKPYECYEVALYVFYHDNSVTKKRFQQVAILESVPENGPFVKEQVERHKVIITWSELPRDQHRGCITKYTIYLQNSSGYQTLYTVQASQKAYTIEYLSPDVYSLWMSASTTKGEGPAGQKIKIFIEEDLIVKEESQLILLVICVVAALMVLFLLCFCQSSAVKQRFCEVFQCLVPRAIPDPANSQWAQECKKKKGKIILQPPSSNLTITKEDDDETNLVDVEELPVQTSDTSVPANISSKLPLLKNPSPETELPTLQYPTMTTYIKSFSHDSDSSDNTQTSLGTTVDYISSQGPGHMDGWEEEEEEEEDEELVSMHFFPSHNVFMESLETGGKLTLDAVKIDCSDFFQNI